MKIIFKYMIFLNKNGEVKNIKTIIIIALVVISLLIGNSSIVFYPIFSNTVLAKSSSSSSTTSTSPPTILPSEKMRSTEAPRQAPTVPIVPTVPAAPPHPLPTQPKLVFNQPPIANAGFTGY
jgi:hypothetical protein